jgi:transposase
MVRVPTAEEEDRRRLCRERRTLTAERIEHVNCIKGLLFSQGVVYEPLHGNRRKRLQDLKTGDGRPLPSHLKAVNLTGSNLLLKQIAAVQAERASDVAFEAKASIKGLIDYGEILTRFVRYALAIPTARVR